VFELADVFHVGPDVFWRNITDTDLRMLNTMNSATQYNVMPPPNATIWLFLAFGEDEPKRAEKQRASSGAAEAVRWRPSKAHTISNRLAALSAIEQYHQMCGRTNDMPPLDWLPEECSKSHPRRRRAREIRTWSNVWSAA
jgi:hypothetical protein